MPENKYQKEAALFLRMPDGRRCTLRIFPAWNAGTVRLLALYAGKAFYKRSTLCSAAVPAFWLLSAEQIISAYQKARDNCACNPDAFQQHHNYHSDRNPKHCKSAYLFHISTSILSNLTLPDGTGYLILYEAGFHLVHKKKPPVIFGFHH